MRNSFEKRIGDQLKKLGVKYEYEAKKIPYTLYYIPDFTVNNKIIETKGYFRPIDRTKMLAVKRHNPDLDIYFVFQTDNKISKKSRYSDWCNKHGFKYAIGSVPKEWLQ